MQKQSGVGKEEKQLPNNMEIDATQALKDTENALRDFIAMTLEASFGAKWTEQCGVTPERIAQWSKRKESEVARQEGGVVEPRLIYYADFFDIQTILKKHWDKFSVALGDWKTMDVYLRELEKLRDPDAHRRELLPHQKHLCLGIAGEIRTRLIRYRSKTETSDDYFPRIECVRDNLGDVWTPGGPDLSVGVGTKKILRPGDRVEFVVTASDPRGEPLSYRLIVGHNEVGPWLRSNTLVTTITEKHISRLFSLQVEIASPRLHHAQRDSDDSVNFLYTVLPKK